MDFISLARKAGFIGIGSLDVRPAHEYFLDQSVQRLCEVVVAEERKRCCSIIDSMFTYTGGHGQQGCPGPRELIQAINKEPT